MTKIMVAILRTHLSPYSENLEGSGHLGDTVVDEKTILKCYAGTENFPTS